MLIRELMDNYQLDGISYMGIDRVVIGIPLNPTIPDNLSDKDKLIMQAEKMKDAIATICHIESMFKEVFGIVGKPLKKIPMLKRFHIISESESKNLIATVLVGRNPNGIPVLNFEFNPSKLSHEDWQELEVALQVLLFNHYEELYDYGVVSHFEFFLDLEQYSLGDLILLSLQRRSHSEFKSTQYRGKRASNVVGTIYDKAAESKLIGNLTRIEVRLNRRDMPFKNLAEGNVANPLEGFIVVPSEALQTISAEWKNPHLGTHIKNLGLHDGISNKHARAAIIKRLKELTVPCWKPEKLWANYKAMLSEFRPSFFGGYDKQYAPLHYGLTMLHS